MYELTLTSCLNFKLPSIFSLNALRREADSVREKLLSLFLNVVYCFCADILIRLTDQTLYRF